MSRKSLFIPEGNWYKGNTHLHTNLSDGSLSPYEATAIYKEAGYSFVAVTDHWYYGNHQDLASEDFLVFAGVEMDIMLGGQKGLCHHVTALANPAATPYKTGERLEQVRALGDMAEMVEHMNKSGHLCIYAHPNWSHIKAEEFDKVSGCVGVEIYNNVCELYCGNGYSESYYNRGLWENRHKFCIASDDAHRRHDYLGGFIGVKAAALTYEDIINALRTGSFYASTGPKIKDFYVEDEQAVLECSPCCDIYFYTDTIPGARIVCSQPGTTKAVFNIPKGSKGVYAVCKDCAGTAWTQIIPL